MSDQSFAEDQYILRKAKAMVAQRFSGIDPANISITMRCLYQNTVDKDFIVGAHPDDPDVVLACGFNGGGFQQAPMVSRLCLQELLGQTDTGFVCPGVAEVETSDFDLKNVSLCAVLEEMKTRFDPDRPSLKVK